MRHCQIGGATYVQRPPLLEKLKNNTKIRREISEHYMYLMNAAADNS